MAQQKTFVDQRPKNGHFNHDRYVQLSLWKVSANDSSSRHGWHEQPEQYVRRQASFIGELEIGRLFHYSSRILQNSERYLHSASCKLVDW